MAPPLGITVIGNNGAMTLLLTSAVMRPVFLNGLQTNVAKYLHVYLKIKKLLSHQDKLPSKAHSTIGHQTTLASESPKMAKHQNRKYHQI